MIQVYYTGAITFTGKDHMIKNTYLKLNTN